MSPREIDRFFLELSRHLPCRATVILTGAGAGTLLGSSRPTQDLDFELRGAGRQRWGNTSLRQILEETVHHVSQKTGIACHFTEDIDHWSSITLLDYRRHARLYRRYGKLTVKVMSPLYWSIGKLGRYLASDTEDLVGVLRRQKIKPLILARLLGRALRRSPTSDALFQFKRQVEGFFMTYGHKVWRGFSGEKAIAAFHNSGGVKS